MKELRHGVPPCYPADPKKMQCSAGVIRIMCELGNFTTAYDFGAGTGIYVYELRKRGVKAIGIELNNKGIRVMPEYWLIKDVGTDLTKELAPVDLCLSIECAEHIDARVAHIFARNLTMLSSDTIILTASDVPAQYHVNPQPLEYWIKLIESYGCHKYGLEESLKLRKQVAQAVIGNGQRWFGSSLMVFRNVKANGEAA